MKRQKTKKVNGLLIFSICLLILAIATPVTLSFFTAQKGGEKNITFGKIELQQGVTQVNVNSTALTPGSTLFYNDVIVAKDIFSEDMIVRAKAPYTTSDGFNTIGLNGTLTLNQLLGGAEYICQAGDGTGLYFVDYGTNNGTVGYTNANGKVASDATGKTYYVLADNVNRGTNGADSIYKATKNSGAVETYFKLDSSEIVETYINGTPTDSGDDIEPITGTVRTDRIATYKAVDTLGNIYNQYIDENNNYVFENTGEPVATGYATGYRWILNNDDGYFYLVNWDGTTSDLTVANSITNSTFYNITKSALLRNRYLKVDSNFNIVSDSTGRDMNTLSGRTTLISDLYDAKIFTVNDGVVTTTYTKDDNNASLKSLNDLLNAVNGAFDDSTIGAEERAIVINNYKQALDLLAVKLDAVQKLFLFVGANEIPLSFSQAVGNDQYNKTVNITVEFDAVQSKNLENVTGVTVANASNFATVKTAINAANPATALAGYNTNNTPMYNALQATGLLSEVSTYMGSEKTPNDLATLKAAYAAAYASAYNNALSVNNTNLIALFPSNS